MPIVYHTQESLNAANALSCGILAAARKPAAGAAGAPHGPLQTVAVRNGPCGEPGKPATPAGSPAAQRTAAPSPRSVTTWATPPRTPFGDDSWLNFVRELQKKGSVPGAMRGDPESGVMCSPNVRPRAVTSFLRQPRKQTDLPPPCPAGAPAVYPSPCASTPEISHGSRLSSTSEDEGISPGLAPDERPQPATDTIAVATHPRRPAIIVEVWRKDTQAHSDDEGHGGSRPSSPAGSTGSEALKWDYRQFQAKAIDADLSKAWSVWGGECVESNGMGFDREASRSTAGHELLNFDGRRHRADIVSVSRWLKSLGAATGDVGMIDNDPWAPQSVARSVSPEDQSSWDWLSPAKDQRTSGKVGDASVSEQLDDDDDDLRSFLLETINEEDSGSDEAFYI